MATSRFKSALVLEYICNPHTTATHKAKGDAPAGVLTANFFISHKVSIIPCSTHASNKKPFVSHCESSKAFIFQQRLDSS